MKVLIIEDEPFAAQHLKQMILRYESHIEVLGMLDSVSMAIDWLNKHPAPDLIFMDIQLADGISFRLFDEIDIQTPLIFTTAYDEYAIKAFKHNSVDYLLKPLDYEALAQAMDKFVKIHQAPSAQRQLQNLDLAALRQMILSESPTYKSRFVVKKGEHLHAVAVEDILYFYAEDKISLFRTAENQRFIVDYTLAELVEKVDPRLFFRINRKYLARHSAIEDIITYSNRRLKIKLRHSPDNDIYISREKVVAFKEWLDG